MPLRYVRSKLTAANALTVAVATTTITRELADMAQFPPARAAASLLLLIFQTIQNVQTNRSECYRLARRCLTLLVDMKEQMQGGWEDAPGSLLRNYSKFEKTLTEIHQFMSREADHKWRTRLMRKSTIEEALADFNIRLDDAARAFQISTLINIQLALGDRSQSPALRVNVEQNADKSNKIFSEVSDLVDLTSSPVSVISSMSFSSDLRELASENDDDGLSQRSLSEEFVLISQKAQAEIAGSIAQAVPAAILDPDLPLSEDHGFRRYTQSDVQLKGRTRFKSGWWANSFRGRVDGRDVVVKSYDGPRGDTMKKWIRDVKILQNVYHPNLPQMVGYSNDEAPTPFILLANVQTRLPQALILDMIENASLASCAVALLRLYRDTLDATLYVQRQLDLSDNKAQDYVENTTFVVDNEGTVIMGLPPPELTNWVSWRNYGLAHSIRDIYMRILPNRGYAAQPYEVNNNQSVELQQKISHLTVLFRALLPDDADAGQLSVRLNEIIDTYEKDDAFDSSSSSLRSIRSAALSSSGHGHTWKQGTVTPFRYSIGDLGYIPHGKGFDDFCVLQNVVTDGLVSFDLVHNAIGWQGSWENGFRRKQDLQAFPAQLNTYGWTIVLPPSTTQDVQVVHDVSIASPSEGWKFLLEHGKTLAEAHAKRPEELVLVTRVGMDQQFNVRDLRQIPFMHNHHHTHHRGYNTHPAIGMPAPGFGHHRANYLVPSFGGHQQHMQHTHMNSFMAQQMQPLVLYLFTALDKDYEPYWSESPVYQSLPKGVQRPEIGAKCVPSIGRCFGNLNYVQLHSEDFVVSRHEKLSY